VAEAAQTFGNGAARRRIAVISMHTSPTASLGQNANGGLNGHHVNVVNEDDAGDGGRALSEAKDLVQNRHVIAIVGAPAALTEASWASYINSTGVPVIGGDCATPEWNSNPDF